MVGRMEGKRAPRLSLRWFTHGGSNPWRGARGVVTLLTLGRASQLRVLPWVVPPCFFYALYLSLFWWILTRGRFVVFLLFLARGLFNLFLWFLALYGGLTCLALQTRGQFRGVSQAQVALIMLPFFPLMLAPYPIRPSMSFIWSAIHLVPRAVNGGLVGGGDEVLLQVWVMLLNVFSKVRAKPGVMAITVARLRVHLRAALATAESAISNRPFPSELPFVTCGGWANP